jgi:hypothetical protein
MTGRRGYELSPIILVTTLLVTFKQRDNIFSAEDCLQVRLDDW